MKLHFGFFFPKLALNKIKGFVILMLATVKEYYRFLNNFQKKSLQKIRQKNCQKFRQKNLSKKSLSKKFVKTICQKKFVKKICQKFRQ
jgi:hypothetical protein